MVKWHLKIPWTTGKVQYELIRQKIQLWGFFGVLLKEQQVTSASRVYIVSANNDNYELFLAGFIYLKKKRFIWALHQFFPASCLSS